jgi:hypothetical protein
MDWLLAPMPSLETTFHQVVLAVNPNASLANFKINQHSHHVFQLELENLLLVWQQRPILIATMESFRRQRDLENAKRLNRDTLWGR